jgi:two-component system response regulator DesR
MAIMPMQNLKLSFGKVMIKNKSNIAKIIVVDGNDDFRAGYIEYLNNYNGLNVIGEARDGFEAFKKIEKLKPDIVFMDISMPKMDGLTAAHLIKEKYPHIKIVITTIYEESVLKELAGMVPVEGFISKSSISLELPKVLRKLESSSAVQH